MSDKSRMPAARGQAQQDRRSAVNHDAHVGHCVRALRILKGLSQVQLANAIGVSYQQVHKYETGTNRLTAGRLHALAQILGIAVKDFFDGLAPIEGSRPEPHARRQLKLLQAAVRITNPQHRTALCDIVRAVAHLETGARSDVE
jgi:transcriptional regulator with XRE-family HTH domain